MQLGDGGGAGRSADSAAQDSVAQVGSVLVDVRVCAPCDHHRHRRRADVHRLLHGRHDRSGHSPIFHLNIDKAIVDSRLRPGGLV